MTDEEKGDAVNAFWALLAGVTFGLWQGSWAAGVFACVVLMPLFLRAGR